MADNYKGLPQQRSWQAYGGIDGIGGIDGALMDDLVEFTTDDGSQVVMADVADVHGSHLISRDDGLSRAARTCRSCRTACSTGRAQPLGLNL